MTIGIGVLASEEGNELKPNRVILIADTKGSFGDSYSMNRLHKVFLYPGNRVYPKLLENWREYDFHCEMLVGVLPKQVKPFSCMLMETELYLTLHFLGSLQ